MSKRTFSSVDPLEDAKSNVKILRFGPTAKDCKSFSQLSSFYKKNFNITLHAVDPEAATRVLCGEVAASASAYSTPTMVLEGIKDRFDKTSVFEGWSHMPRDGVFYYLNGTTGSPKKDDRIFSPRTKAGGMQGRMSVEARWGLSKQYADPKLTESVFHELYQDEATDVAWAIRRAPSIAAYRKEHKAYPDEVRFVSMHVRSFRGTAQDGVFGDPFCTSKKPVARRHIYSKLYLQHLETTAYERYKQHEDAIQQCPLHLTVIGRDYDCAKRTDKDGTIVNEAVAVDNALLEDRVSSKHSFGHMFLLMAKLGGVLGDFASRKLMSGAVVHASL